jgi:hypothetical protein
VSSSWIILLEFGIVILHVIYSEHGPSNFHWTCKLLLPVNWSVRKSELGSQTHTCTQIQLSFHLTSKIRYSNLNSSWAFSHTFSLTLSTYSYFPLSLSTLVREKTKAKGGPRTRRAAKMDRPHPSATLQKHETGKNLSLYRHPIVKLAQP